MVVPCLHALVSVRMPSTSTNDTPTPLEVLGTRAFSRVAEAQQSDGNGVRLLCDAAGNYPAWLTAIDGARTTIHLENYIFADDATGQQFAEAIVRAVRRGVSCRVLYDWLGCRTRTSERFWRKLREAGVVVRCYNPPRLDNPLGWLSRNHRKLLCVDSRIAYVGGLCIADEWAGDDGRAVPPWRDTAVEISGPAIVHLEVAFADSWQSAGAALPLAPQQVPKPDPAGNLSTWVIAGRPNSMGLYKLEQLVAEIVERTLWLSDAYFVATSGYVRALCGAARAGVDVRLLVPGSSDLAVVRTLSQAGYRPLLEAGVRVFEWNGPMMHAKTAVADGCWTRIGSSNSNFASWISNRELDVTFKDRRLAEEMTTQFERDMQNSTEIVLEPGRLRLPSIRRDGHAVRARRLRASRLFAGVVGLGNIVGATVSQRRTPGAAEGIVLLVAAALLVLLGSTAFLLPRVLAYFIGGFCAWLGLAVAMRAWRLRLPYKDRPRA
jgi:cardiolipin synthase